MTKIALRPQTQIPYGYQHKPRGKLQPEDRVWMPQFQAFRTPDTQDFSRSVRDYQCVIERK